jgi:pyruvate kinase
VNLPDTPLNLESMTPENEEDLRFAVANDVTYLAASFVRHAADVERIRSFLAAEGSSIPIIAKIENRSGVEHMDEIVAAADGAMVARGDLGVEIPLEQVPIIQKLIIRTTVGSGKPVITATQMLDSMERSQRPTRAEVSDVANAILDGTSAVMLSGETAAGAYPVEAVSTMAKIAREAEASLAEFGMLQNIRAHPSNVVTEAVAQAALTMANHLDAAAVVVLSETGFTARSISKYRPRCPILAVTVSAAVVRRLSMNWGVTAVLFEGERSDEAMLSFALARGRGLGCIAGGDVVIATAGVDRKTGSTDSIRVLSVPE